MKRKKNSTSFHYRAIFASAVFISSYSTAQEYVPYTVKFGDTLSGALSRTRLWPIYGKEGSLDKALEINPDLQKFDGHLIFPGQTILLPVKQDVQSTEMGSNTVPLSDETLPLDEAPVASDEVPETIDEAPNAKPKFSYFASLGVDFFSLKGVDNVSKDTSIILSEASPHVGLGLKFHLNERTFFSFSTQIQQYSFQPLNDEQSFDEDSGSRFNFNLSALHSVSDSWILGAGISYDQDLFFYAPSPSILSVDKVFISKPGIFARFKAFQSEHSVVGLDGKLGLNLSNETNNYEIESGYHTGAGLFYSRHFQDKALEARAFYSVDKQDTSVAQRDFSNLSFMIVYEWKLP